MSATPAPQRPDPHRPRLRRARARRPDRPLRLRAARAAPRRRRLRRPLLRHLPHRPPLDRPLGPGVPDRPRPRDDRPGHRGRRERHRARVGDTVAVSVIVDSCGECEPCRNEMEIYCEEGPTNTYDGIDRVDGSRTRGGYAESLVAHQRFVHPRPRRASTWPAWRRCSAPGSPPGRRCATGRSARAARSAWSASAGSATSASSSPTRSAPASSPSPPRPDKRDTILALGADEVVVSTDEEQMAAQRGKPRLPPRHRLGRLPDDAADGDAEARRHDLLGRHPGRLRRQPYRCSPRSASASPAPAPAAPATCARCSPSAPSTTSPPTSRSSAPTRSTRPSTASPATTSATAS